MERKWSTNFTAMSSNVGILGRDLDGDLQHVLAEERHPRRAVRLLEVAAGRQRRRAVEDADVVEAEEAALEHVLAEPILAVHPPGEVREQLAERSLQEVDVAVAVQRLLAAVEEDRRPGVHRRIDVGEVPLVRRHLAARVQVHLAEHQLELRLREVDVDGATAPWRGTPDPTPRTRGTPTCPAWRSRRR